MKVLCKLFFVTAAIFFCATALHAQDFSADIESLVNGRVIKGKFYYRADRQRIEGESGSRKQISIFRVDKKLVWHIADQQKRYIELPLSEQEIPGFSIPGEVRREAIGKEKIQGLSTTKYKVYFRINNREDFLYQWVDEKYRIRVKISDKDGKFISELLNIKIGPQPDELFELPTGYTRYTIGLKPKQ